ncbi:membrane protein [Leisingera sp. ANG-M6]|nr:membrane protein [Leisingera sp. ANG-M6]
MPMVQKTKLCQTLAVVLASTAVQGHSAFAEEYGRLQSNTSLLAEHGTAGGEARTIEFGYGQGADGLIFGGSLSTGQTGPLTRALQAEETHQLRLQAGYDFGPATGFVTVGGLQAEASSGRRHGSLFGFGMRVSLNRALQLTGELLHHEAGPTDGSASPRGETLAVSAAFRF